MFDYQSTFAGAELGLKVAVAGKTDRGLVRSGNEDNLRIDFDRNLFLVCDGMGGHLAGEVASREACEIINHCFTGLSEEILNDSVLAIPAKFPPTGDLLVKAIRIANRSIYIKSRSRSDYAGMGTTVVAAVLEDDIINIAHVGDSRAYLLNGERLVPLTMDHSWISELEQSGKYSKEEAAQLVNRNIITRALGIHETIEIDYRAYRAKPGDIYILCSDGLCGYADDNEIFAVAKNCGNDVNMIVDTLIQMANDRGGTDNVTVIAIRIDEVESSGRLEEITPVTISAEGDDTVLRENQVIESIARLEEDKQKAILKSESRTRASGFPILVAILLIVIALVVIYYLFSK